MNHGPGSLWIPVLNLIAYTSTYSQSRLVLINPCDTHYANDNITMTVAHSFTKRVSFGTLTSMNDGDHDGVVRIHEPSKS